MGAHHCPWGTRLGHSPQSVTEVVGQLVRGRVVEDERCGKSQTGGVGQPVAQFERGQRIEAQLPQGLVAGHRGVAGVSQHGGDMGPDQLEQGSRALGLRRWNHLVQQGTADLAGRRRGRRPAHEVPQDHWYRCVDADPPDIQVGGDHRGEPDADGPVEQAQCPVGGQRKDTAAPVPVQVAVTDVGGHLAASREESPGQGEPGQAAGPPVLGERVEHHVGRGVGALPGTPDHARQRGEHHERREVPVLGQLVQVERAVHLGPQHAVDLVLGRRLDKTVRHRPGRVHHPDERMLGRDVGEHPGQGVPVGHVARAHRHPGAEFGQVRDQVVRSLAATPADQQQVGNSVFGHQVARDETAQCPGAAGDQHRAVLQPRWVSRRLRAPVQSGHQNRARPDRHLVLARAQRGGERGLGRGVAVGVAVDVGVGVDEQQPPRMLGLRRPDQAPHRGGAEIAHILVGPGRHRVPGHEHQPAVAGALVSQPGPQPRHGLPECPRGCCGGRHDVCVDLRRLPLGRVVRCGPPPADVEQVALLGRWIVTRLRGVRPVALPVEGVARQVGGLGAAEDGGPVHVGALGVRLPHRERDAFRSALASAQRRGDRRRFPGVLDDVEQRRGQHRMCPHLDEDPVLVAEEVAHRGVEVHPLAHVAVPVGGVQSLGVEPVPGHGRVERDRRRPAPHRRQVGEELFAQQVHVRGVAGGVHPPDAARRNPVRHAGPDELVTGVHVPGERAGRRAVDGGQGQSARPAGQPVTHLGFG